MNSNQTISGRSSDLNFWLDYFKHTHPDVICLSAAGVIVRPAQLRLRQIDPWGKTI